MSEGPLLRPEEVQTVLSGADEATAAAGRSAEGVLPYSLREPVALPPEAEEPAKQRLNAIAAALSAELSRELGEAVSIEVDSFQQHRAGAALEALPKPVWILSFVERQPGGIALAVPAAVGLALVERALGGVGALPEVSRAPTPLESKLLGRLAAALAPAVASAASAALSAAPLSCGNLPCAVAAPGETVGVGVGRVRLAGAERSALLLASPSLLVAETSADRAAESSGRPGPLARALGRLQVRIRPVLRAGRVRIAELAALEPGAVLRLEAAEDAPFELRVEGRAVFAGRIQRGEQKPAFLVSRRFEQPRAVARRKEG